MDKQYVDLTANSPINTDKLTVASAVFGDFVPSVGAWKINPNVTHFKLNLNKQSEILLKLNICMPNGLNFQVDINGENFGDPYHSNSMDELFIDLIIPLPKYALKGGDNFINICLANASDICYLRACSIDIIEDTYNTTYSPTPKTPKEDYTSNWLKFIKDDVSLSDLNLPGTHDSAAIDEKKEFNIFTRQNLTITEQLQQGIRILDIRLTAKNDDDSCILFTCHSQVTCPKSEFQTFASLIEECKVFLSKYYKETIVMSLKFDNWGDYKEAKDVAKEALEKMLTDDKYVDLFAERKKGNCPKLGDVRGKIYLLNRINNELALGVPISWDDKKTEGTHRSSSPPREFAFYVQDKWANLKFWKFEDDKFEIVKNAWAKKEPNEPLINFASATIWQFVFMHSNQLHKMQNTSDLSTLIWQGNNIDATQIYSTSPCEGIFYVQDNWKDSDNQDSQLLLDANKSQEMLAVWLKKANEQTNVIAVRYKGIVCIHNKFLRYWQEHGCSEYGWFIFDYPNSFNTTNENGESITVIDVIIDSNKKYCKTKISVHFSL
ncbi:MAG: phosphatidylinositol-specific phospholipase C domain-containing protein [Candidatus Bathyarchaeota archaeon]|nr:phosphatidylinositol-specific phospholipase C domain-containing protein [Candidatus Termiticorpusculum sp.]